MLINLSCGEWILVTLEDGESIEDPKYVEGIQAAIEACGNHL